MGVALEVLEISNENYSILRSFISSLREELHSFRYFKTRGQEVLKNHLFTCLVFKNKAPIAYGHLDKEGGIVWLGIVVRKDFQGQGFGKQLMQLLIDKGKKLGVSAIQLSVDKNNSKALELYKFLGFELVRENKENAIMRKNIVHPFEKLDLGISSLAFRGKKREEIIAIALRNKWMIEFSSSFPYLKDMADFFINVHTIRRLAHNYFPAPVDPFVLNLASLNPLIRERSIAHCLNGLEISKLAGASCFSAHAGFCIDPNPDQLGSELDVNIPINRRKNWKLFLESVNIIVRKAEQLGLSFYIENNVTAEFNLRDDGQEVLLCSSIEEMMFLCKEIRSKHFGLLLDTAHLKVSSRSLHFDIETSLESLIPFVKYVHHSDNNGKEDTNESLNSDYWFLPWIHKFKHCIHILEVKNLDEDAIKNQLTLLNSYDKRKNTHL